MLTTIVLTHNSEKTLTETLKSVNFSTEVLVIDDNSTDGTRDIALKYKIRVFSHGVDEDFAAQRNFGLQHASQQWVLFVDSDEIVTTDLKNEILNAITSTQVDGYFIKRMDIVFGKALKYGETGTMQLLRLGRKNAGKWVRPVHEVWDIKGKTEFLQQPLLHFPHPNVSQFLESINTYSTVNAMYLYNQGVREPVWKIPVYPIAKFLYNYMWRLGFLDGAEGIVVALMMSFHSFLTRAKLSMLWANRK